RIKTGTAKPLPRHSSATDGSKKGAYQQFLFPSFPIETAVDRRTVEIACLLACNAEEQVEGKHPERNW
ncbi:MAG TPA: hypothetical protein VGO43_02945, partial [Pyrinomonadaceae bacterium]|nr:hypothetical protein [Pyrinomonadaceae bacterium]